MEYTFTLNELDARLKIYRPDKIRSVGLIKRAGRLADFVAFKKSTPGYESANSAARPTAALVEMLLGLDGRIVSIQQEEDLVRIVTG